MDELWNDDLIQFARLLSEINAVGFRELDWTGLCDSMDLTHVDIDDLFDRADAVWEQAKERL